MRIWEWVDVLGNCVAKYAKSVDTPKLVHIIVRK